MNFFLVKCVPFKAPLNGQVITLGLGVVQVKCSPQYLLDSKYATFYLCENNQWKGLVGETKLPMPDCLSKFNHLPYV